MKHQNHTALTATAAIAAALALSATPLAAQSVDAPAPEAPAMQVPPAQPAPPPVVASPAPTIVIRDVSAAPASGAGTAEPAAAPIVKRRTVRTTTTSAPAKPTMTRTTVTRTATRSAPAAAAPIAAVPAPANDVAPPAAETLDSAPPAAVASSAAQPTPTQRNDVIGTLGVILLGLLALAILAAGLLFLRRRSPAEALAEPEPLVTDATKEPRVAEPTVASMTRPTALRQREASPVADALPSEGAAVDLPATAPDDYAKRTALFERMVNARPDKANPFTDRAARMRRARLIMQSLGVTFDREPLIDLSQYPNNWPELWREYHKAA